MIRNKAVLFALISVVIAALIWFLLSMRSDSKHSCDDVTKITMPSDVGGVPDDIYTGDQAIQVCKEQGLNARGEGGFYRYEFK